jgi:hypothetical protein
VIGINVLSRARSRRDRASGAPIQTRAQVLEMSAWISPRSAGLAGALFACMYLDVPIASTTRRYTIETGANQDRLGEIASLVEVIRFKDFRR